jgi:hypothetical protein
VDNPRIIGKKNLIMRLIQWLDPSDVKPSGWDDEPKLIDDPIAVKPEDWDDVDDGLWIKPKVNSPKYKGKWKPKVNFIFLLTKI